MSNHDLVHLKISRKSTSEQNQSENTPTKISISTIPHNELGEFKHSITGTNYKSSNNSFHDNNVFMITLAGENSGANMAIGSLPPPATHPNVNNNVQSVNNSAMHQSSCAARDPGVHLEIVSVTDRVERIDHKEPVGVRMMRSGLDLSQERRPENAPRIRRRCLRSLFMESESDIEDAARKPRRHGCRYKCEDKKEREG